MDTSKKNSSHVRTNKIKEQLQEFVEKNLEIQNEEDKKLLKSCVSSIRREFKKVENSSFNISFKLHMIYYKQLYKLKNYNNIYDFSNDTFGLARGTTSNFINIAETFGVKSDYGIVTSIKDEFKDYDYTKLIVLLGCPQDFLNQVNSSMSVRELKERKREYKDMIEHSDIEFDVDDKKDDSISSISNGPEHLEKVLVLERLENLKDLKKLIESYIFECSKLDTFGQQRYLKHLDDNEPFIYFLGKLTLD